MKEHAPDPSAPAATAGALPQGAPHLRHAGRTSALAEVAPAPAAPAAPRPDAAKRRWPVGPVLRRTAAVALLGAALWWLVVPLLFAFSSDAVVNARLVQVRAPVDGMADELYAAPGDVVHAGQPLARIHNPRVDTTHLALLRARHAEWRARRDRLGGERAAVARAAAACRQTAERYRRGRVTVLEAAAQEARAQAEAARHQEATAQAQLSRARSLAQKKAFSTTELELAGEAAVIARKKVEQLEAALARTGAECDAAGEGIFLGGATPPWQPRVGELQLKGEQLDADAREAEAMVAALNAELAKEERRVAALASATAASPVAGVVWTCLGNRGQVVKQNEMLYEVADGGGLFVEALVHQRHLTRVAVGARAVIRLTGGAVYEGRVRAVRTPGPLATGAGHVVQLPAADAQQGRVLIDFVAAGGASPTALIGRHAQVLLLDAEPGPAPRLVAWVFARAAG